MGNQFGKSLRFWMSKMKIKESELAGALSYDATYISKWMNGSKLPSARNAEKIITQIADFVMERIEGATETKKLSQRQECYMELKIAYANDSSYLAFQSYNNSQMFFIDSRRTLFQLTSAAFLWAVNMCDRRICITATFDIFKLYGEEFKRLMSQISEAGVEKIELKLALTPEDMISQGQFYAANILNTIGDFDYIEMSIVCRKAENPNIIVINDLFCLQVLWNMSGELSAVFSMENKIINKFSNLCRRIMENSEKILNFADPERLRRTNVQLDSYSDKRQWHFFNEPPAILFPEEIMDIFIEHTDDKNYAGYLMNLKNVFAKQTKKARIDLVIYSSMLNQYLTDGNISVGNVSHHLTPEQVRSHLSYLSEVMTQNPNLKVYVIRDTVVLSEEMRNLPSIFLDTYSLNIENSKNHLNDNYHISMDPYMRMAFQQFFEAMLNKPFCNRISAEDVLRYL